MRALPILLLAAALGACAGEPAADPAATGDTATTAAMPASRTDVFADEYAEVATITLAPGEALPVIPPKLRGANRGAMQREPASSRA